MKGRRKGRRNTGALKKGSRYMGSNNERGGQ
jgi:hypothetical protein